jgi:hypothetical protein
MDTNTASEVVVEPVTQPVTETEQTVESSIEETVKSETKTPNVEFKEGKLFVDGERRFSRSDANKIIASEKDRIVNSLLQELDVDSLDQVKDVVKQIKTLNPEDNSLNVGALKQTLAKREATVEELQAEVKSLKTDLLLKDHMNNLNSNMPGDWSVEQKTAVVDLMKARNMFAVQDGSFQLRSGDEFLTTDGETPDYEGAIKLVASSLGLNTGKKGVDVKYGDGDKLTDSAGSRQPKALDESRISSDPEYRRAYMHIREYRPSVRRADITNNMVIKQMESMRPKR